MGFIAGSSLVTAWQHEGRCWASGYPWVTQTPSSVLLLLPLAPSHHRILQSYWLLREFKGCSLAWDTPSAYYMPAPLNIPRNVWVTSYCFLWAESGELTSTAPDCLADNAASDFCLIAAGTMFRCFQIGGCSEIELKVRLSQGQGECN